jgi:hypothetical protein|tara:strand:- start:82 stop:273 length:192 start_codon:yes stop_codon:yes gene_type:complete
MLMGTNRLQRAINYVEYLDDYAATRANASTDGEKWPITDFFVGGHNNSAFYASEAFKSWAYGV